MHEVDARGLDCPKPVIETKKALANFDELITIVDNEVAAKNVSKLAKQSGCKVSIIEESSNLFRIIIKKDKTKSSSSTVASDKKVYLIKSEYLGEGDVELGKILMKGYISTLKNIEPLPQRVIFINSGVKLPTLYPDITIVLEELIAKGVEVFACGTCLDYYDLKEELTIGEISNMYEILDSLNNNQVVTV